MIIAAMAALLFCAGMVAGAQAQDRMSEQRRRRASMRRCAPDARQREPYYLVLGLRDVVGDLTDRDGVGGVRFR